MKKVLFCMNIPSPYRVAFFNELGKHCELTALFEIDSSTERDASWKKYSFDNFRGVLMSGIRTGMDSAFCPEIIRYLKKDEYDEIILCNATSLTGLLAAVYMRLKKLPYYYEGDGGTAGKSTGIKAAWKKFVIGAAKGCFSTCEFFDDYCRTYGGKEIIRYPFSSVNDADVVSTSPSMKERRLVRDRLGLMGERVILAVGRMVEVKGFDVLLRAFAELSDPQCHLYIVGGKQTAEMETLQKSMGIEKQVHVVDFMLPKMLKEYYKASDIFVLPSRYEPWGLVVNEAMAAGLPVITTTVCGAGMEMIEHQVNGYLYEAENADGLKRLLEEHFTNPERWQHMAECACRTAKKYTIETMVKKHLEVLDISENG